MYTFGHFWTKILKNGYCESLDLSVLRLQYYDFTDILLWLYCIINSSVTKVYWLCCTFVPIFKENMYCYKCFGFYQLIWFDNLHISIKCLVILGWKLPKRCVCSKMLNHGLNHELFLSIFKLIPCQVSFELFRALYMYISVYGLKTT